MWVTQSCAVSLVASNPLQGMMCGIFVKWSTTISMEVNPSVLGNSTIKPMETSAQGWWGCFQGLE